MINNIWDTVLLISFQASIVALIILIVKKLFNKRISPTWGYLIWTILILKLIIPFGPESKFSLFNTVGVVKEEASQGINYELYNNEKDNTTEQTTQIISSDGTPIENDKVNNNENTYKPSTNKVTTEVDDNIVKERSIGIILTSAKDIISYLWIFASISILVVTILFNIIFNINIKKHKVNDHGLDDILKNCKEKIVGSNKVQLIVTDYISTPYLTGIVNPRILLPLSLTNLSKKELEYIMLHELCHYKRKDILMNYMMIVLQAIHWFNPFIWYSFKQIKESMEYATDEKVLRVLEDNEYKSYGMTLLNIVSSSNLNLYNPSVMSMANDKKEIKKRLINLKLSNYAKSKSSVFKIFGVILIMGLSVSTLTSSLQNEKDNIKVVADNEISKLDTQYLELIEMTKDSSVKVDNVKQVFGSMKPTEEGQVVPRDTRYGQRYEYGMLEYMIDSDSKAESISMGYTDNNQNYVDGNIEYANRNTGIFSSYSPTQEKFFVERTIQGLGRTKKVLEGLEESIIESDIYNTFIEICMLYEGENIPELSDMEGIVQELKSKGETTKFYSTSLEIKFANGYIMVSADTDIHSVYMSYEGEDFSFGINSGIRYDNYNERVDGLNHYINYNTSNEEKFKYIIPSIENALY